MGSILLSFASGQGGGVFFRDAFKFLMNEVFWWKKLEKLNRNRFSGGILRIEYLCGSICGTSLILGIFFNISNFRILKEIWV